MFTKKISRLSITTLSRYGTRVNSVSRMPVRLFTGTSQESM